MAYTLSFSCGSLLLELRMLTQVRRRSVSIKLGFFAASNIARGNKYAVRHLGWPDNISIKT